MRTSNIRRSVAFAAVLATVCSAAGASTALALNPQPLPPRVEPLKVVFLNPQPLPPSPPPEF